MSKELLDLAAQYEIELELILKEKNAIELDFINLYHNPVVEWNYKILWRIFDLLVQTLFPENLIERIELPTDTPFDKYPFILKEIVEKLKKCKHIVVIKEYDTLYYCIE